MSKDLKPRPGYYFGILEEPLIGALMYIKRIPEKFYPGKFDIFGSSHQFFHLFVVAGIITHYIGSLDAFYYRVENQCPV